MGSCSSPAPQQCSHCYLFTLNKTDHQCLDAGNDSPQVAPPTGAPAMTVPMGFVQGAGRTALPAGLQFLARPWDEGRLLRVAFAYEQATRHRRCRPHA